MAKELDRFDPNPKKNISLKAKLIGMIVGASIIGVSVTGAAALVTFNSGLNEQTERELLNTTDGIEWILQDWLNTLGGYGDMLASIDHIKGYLDGTYIEDSNAYVREKALLCGLDMLGLVDLSGKVIAGYEVATGYKNELPMVKRLFPEQKAMPMILTVIWVMDCFLLPL